MCRSSVNGMILQIGWRSSFDRTPYGFTLGWDRTGGALS
jgi:hypothetical protein